MLFCIFSSAWAIAPINELSVMMSKYRLFEIFTVAGRPVERQKKSEFCKDILGFFLDESFLVQR